MIRPSSYARTNAHESVISWRKKLHTLIQNTGLSDITCTLTVSHTLPHQGEEAPHGVDGKWYYEEKRNDFQDKLVDWAKSILSTKSPLVYPGDLYNDIARPVLQRIRTGTQAYQSIIENPDHKSKCPTVTVKTMRPKYAHD